jgi:hypothetical protein
MTNSKKKKKNNDNKKKMKKKETNQNQKEKKRIGNASNAHFVFSHYFFSFVGKVLNPNGERGVNIKRRS